MAAMAGCLYNPQACMSERPTRDAHTRSHNVRDRVASDIPAAGAITAWAPAVTSECRACPLLLMLVLFHHGISQRLRRAVARSI